ncbi:hypothetical protein CRG98_046746 [Punica granatum]|uniref:Uncharacterized protein n=1 Tax=Punica granatum TaxID=22663 RepID=A0A2I0HMH9_PUNGR|nr:hypothetical protein CRG98_046746 [Punica granatum]
MTGKKRTGDRRGGWGPKGQPGEVGGGVVLAGMTDALCPCLPWSRPHSSVADWSGRALWWLPSHCAACVVIQVLNGPNLRWANLRYTKR